MSEKRELILKYRNDVVDGKKLTRSTISELFNINNEFLLDLSDAANHITRHFHGSKVDIEELVNMIVAQRAFEMTSKAVESSDQMMQTVNALKR